MSDHRPIRRERYNTRFIVRRLKRDEWLGRLRTVLALCGVGVLFTWLLTLDAGAESQRAKPAPMVAITHIEPLDVEPALVTTPPAESRPVKQRPQRPSHKRRR
jgi:hypothetical protein